MKKIHIIEKNGKKLQVTLDTQKDRCIYSESEYEQTRGTNLYCHTSKSADNFFYLKHWSRWQNENSSIEILTKEQALNFCSKNSDQMNDEDFEDMQKSGLMLEEA